MKNYALENKDGKLALEIAKSPLVTETSEAAQTLRFARDSDPDSPVKAIQEITKARSESLERKIKFNLQDKQKVILRKTLDNRIRNTRPSKIFIHLGFVCLDICR